jgi:quercetin dioxygenase-like cupin family protein
VRVSLRDLKGVSQGGLLARYALLGPAAFVFVELPASGTAGTNLEDWCQMEHWGLMLEGTLRLDGSEPRELQPGTAFYIPPDGPPHRFIATDRVTIAGFTPLREPVDTSPEALQARGLQIETRMPTPAAPPPLMRVANTPSRLMTRGQIEVETAEMGQWLFTQTTFGPLSGYTSGWCDLTHWGLVLSGDLILDHENSLEVLTAGDVFYCPAGPPGHQFEVADRATIIDYTPIDEIGQVVRQEAWRRARSAPASSLAGATRSTRSAARSTSGGSAAGGRGPQDGPAARAADPFGRSDSGSLSPVASRTFSRVASR